jgi:hypothetical protein
MIGRRAARTSITSTRSLPINPATIPPAVRAADGVDTSTSPEAR